MLEENNKDTQEKLKLAREKEIEFLKKEQALLSKEQELDLQLQKMLLEERNKLADVIRKEEAEKIRMVVSPGHSSGAAGWCGALLPSGPSDRVSGGAASYEKSTHNQVE